MSPIIVIEVDVETFSPTFDGDETMLPLIGASTGLRAYFVPGSDGSTFAMTSPLFTCEPSITFMEAIFPFIDGNTSIALCDSTSPLVIT